MPDPAGDRHGADRYGADRPAEVRDPTEVGHVPGHAPALPGQARGTPEPTARPDPGGHVTGVPPRDLTDEALERELEHLHQTRHGTFLHGSEDALSFHTSRTDELEQEYLRRTPDRVVDARRTRTGNRELSGQDPT